MALVVVAAAVTAVVLLVWVAVAVKVFSGSKEAYRFGSFAPSRSLASNALTESLQPYQQVTIVIRIKVIEVAVVVEVVVAAVVVVDGC